MLNDDSIQSMGGKARAESLSAEQRAQIAKKASAVRWLKATHKGNFKEEFGIDVECYVLDDENKTAVISQSGMGSALGMSERGNTLPRFLENKAMAGIVSADLMKKITQPIKFQWQSGGAGGAGTPAATVHGFDVTILIDVCRAIVEADSEGVLKRDRYHKTVDQANIILSASAKSGIRGLVYALAGYNPQASEVIAAFKMYVLEEAKKYEKEFPPELYAEWYRLYDIPVPVRGKPWNFKHLTVNHIYYPLARSNGKILELVRATKSKDGDKGKKLFQFLSEIGARALRMQLGRVLEMAESSTDKTIYEQKIADRFYGQPELKFEPLPIE